MNVETKFTPGPWRRAKGNFGNCIEADSGKRTWDGDTGFRPVAMFQECSNKVLASEQDENMEANGALIIAAPDMYAALVTARQQLITIGRDTRRDVASDGTPEGDEIQAAVLDAIDAALTKALATPES